MNRVTRKSNDTFDQILLVIHKELKVAYGAEAEEILKRMQCKIEELQEITEDEFQIELQTFVYPFLACVDAMEERGIREKEAVDFAKDTWYKTAVILWRK